jgi:pimeloyl-ACP methyl ester carboxylesterase
VLVDFLGFGRSDRPVAFDYTLEGHARTVSELLDHLRLADCDLVGHSMGGSVAITLAAVRPDLVGSLVIAESNLDPGGGMVSQPISAQTEEDFVRRGYDEFLRVLDARDEWAHYAATVRLSDRVGLYRSAVSLLAGTTPTMRQRFERADVPRTFIFGERTLPHEDTQRLPRFGIRIEVVANAGHSMMYDNPGGFASAISRGLR